MGCVSSKILAKSGSFQEKVSLGRHSFQRSSAIEEMILSTSKSNGDQFLALLRTSTSSARKAKQEPEAAAVAEPVAKIETIDVSELLAGLEEEESCTAEEARERRQSSRVGSPAAPSPASDGRARSFRTVEDFDAMLLLTQQRQQQTQTQSESGSSPGRAAAALATEQEEELPAATAAATASTAEAELSGGSVGSKAAVVGAKRRARARQLGELNVPAAAFDFCISKSGSLRDWLRQGGQIFSPGSYVTPRFGTSPSPAERGGGAGAGEQQALFDPELVAQFERAMEQLSEEEGRVLDEILEALELEAAEMDGATVVGKLGDHQPPAEPVLVQQVQRVSAELVLKANG